MKLIDEAGKRYAKLTVLERDFSKAGRVHWRCLCDCGNETSVNGAYLRNGRTKSCGHLRVEIGHQEIQTKLIKMQEARRVSAKARRKKGDIRWSVIRGGYIEAHWPEHPLANASGRVLQHWHNFWLHHNKAKWVGQVKHEHGATLHHTNANRADNNPSNLELRWPGRHPHGWTTQAMIEVLEIMGYSINQI